MIQHFEFLINFTFQIKLNKILKTTHKNRFEFNLILYMKRVERKKMGNDENILFVQQKEIFIVKWKRF